ncbi:hypothetical protein N9O33_07435 [Gammaproteobacteria bacterium]|nr:hypothetical protein [Gammaproteobacteria bacterium]MDA9300855.1 hypothetical protein [bacterium]MDB9981423.1 hypothetical protein [Gammaproteobacteria bacterium]
MQIKRLLDDREMVVGDRLFDAQGRYYGLIERSGGELVVTAEDSYPVRLKPEQLGCYVINVNRTDRGLAKERLRDYWADKRVLKAR